MEKNQYLKEFLRENEKSANRTLNGTDLAFFVFPIVVEVIQRFDYSYVMDMANRLVFMPLGIFIAVFSVVAALLKFDRPWIKYVLMGEMILATGLAYLIYGVLVGYMVFLPLVTCIVYFDRRFTTCTTLVTLLFFLISSALKVFLDDTAFFRVLHENSAYDCWQKPGDALFFIIIPMVMTAIFIVFYVIKTSRNSKVITDHQGELARKAATANAEIGMAAEIQKNALPAENFVTPDGNFSISCGEVPARNVGGDFYDYFMVGEHLLTFLIADVSDKGLPAAMFMMSAKKAVRCAIECEHSLEKAVALANKLICEDANGMFLTLWLAIIDTRSGIGRFVNAGHLPPMVRHADGSVSYITNEPELFIGPFPESCPKVHPFRMEEKDMLLLYTDGMTDAMNEEGEPFGQKRLAVALQNAAGDTEEVRRELMDSVSKYSGTKENFDDMTVLALNCSHLEKPEHRRMTFESDRINIDGCIDCVNEMLTERKAPEEIRRNVDVIIDEVLTNIADNAYKDGTGPVSVDVFAGCSYMRMVFTDEGIPFDPLKQPDPDLENGPGIGGLGVWLIRNLADEIFYRYEGGKNKLYIRTIWNF